MLRLRANAANRSVWTMPMAASPISGDDSGKRLIEIAYDPVIDYNVDAADRTSGDRRGSFDQCRHIVM